MTTPVPTTPAPTTPAGADLRVQACFTYKSGASELTVRAWAELVDGGLNSDDLDLPACSAALVNESGATVVSGAGAADAAGSTHALFRLSPVTLAAGHHYLLIVSLQTDVGDVAGPRTFGVPVN